MEQGPNFNSVITASASYSGVSGSINDLERVVPSEASVLSPVPAEKFWDSS